MHAMGVTRALVVATVFSLAAGSLESRPQQLVRPDAEHRELVINEDALQSLQVSESASWPEGICTLAGLFLLSGPGPAPFCLGAPPPVRPTVRSPTGLLCSLCDPVLGDTRAPCGARCCWSFPYGKEPPHESSPQSPRGGAAWFRSGPHNRPRDERDLGQCDSTTHYWWCER